MTTIKPKPNVAPAPTTTPAAPARPAAPAAAPAAAPGFSATSSVTAPKPAVATAPAAPTTLNGRPVKPGDQQIVCPVLGALVASGAVKMQPDGTVNISDLRHAFADNLGFTTTAAFGASELGLAGNTPGDVLHNTLFQQFNVLDLRKGIAKHQGDSAVLTAGRFDEAKFQTLTSHAKNGVMTEDAFAEAIAANYKRDYTGPSDLANAAKGKALAAGEYGALLTVFGTKDPATGQMGIKVSDLRMLFQDQKIPPHSGSKPITDIGLLTAKMAGKTDLQLASQAFRSTSTATGMANAGAKLATGATSSASAQASNGAGKAANCPFLTGAMKMPQGNDVVGAHAKG
ncbi:MAG: hypothetical protein QM723_35195 [Myxococcaceae bacterium]